MRRMVSLETRGELLMTLLEEYKVICMSCNKPVTSNPLRVPVPGRGNRPATEHMFHGSARECADASSINYIYLHDAKHRGVKVG
jgi:hypothetical protein